VDITAANYQLDDKPTRLEHVTGAAAIARYRHGGARGKTLIRI
jgi:hypothetical protein